MNSNSSDMLMLYLVLYVTGLKSLDVKYVCVTKWGTENTLLDVICV